MGKFIRIIIFLYCIILSLNIVCTKKNPEQKITLTFWHTFNLDETETINEIIDNYLKNYPEVHIEVNRADFFAEGGARNKFKTLLNQKKSIDILRLEINWVTEFISLGYILPLDNYVSQKDREDYFEKVLNHNVYDNKLWAIPQVVDCLVLFYNKHLLEEKKLSAPKNFKELVEIAKKLTDVKENKYGFALRQNSYWFVPFIWGYGGDLIDPFGKIKITEKPAIEALQFIIDLQNKYRVIPKFPSDVDDYKLIRNGFKDGQYAMIIDGPWATVDILSGSEFKDISNLGITKIPNGPGGAGSPMGGQCYVITKTCKNPELAYQFINYINSAENQIKFVQKNKLLPTRISVYNSDVVKKDSIVMDFKDCMEIMRVRPVFIGGGEIFEEFEPDFKSVLEGKKNPEEAMKNVAEKWKKYVELNILF